MEVTGHPREPLACRCGYVMIVQKGNGSFSRSLLNLHAGDHGEESA